MKLFNVFYLNTGKIPQQRDFEYTLDYPGHNTFIRRFGSWNKAITAAGFEPNIRNTYGIDTVAKDGHL